MLLGLLRDDVAARADAAADENVPPRSMAALGLLVRERVACVREALEVVAAREVGREPVERAGALALPVGGGAREVLGAEVAAGRAVAGRERPLERRRGRPAKGAADAGRNRRRSGGARPGDRREGTPVGGGGAETAP